MGPDGRLCGTQCGVQRVEVTDWRRVHQDLRAVTPCGVRSHVVGSDDGDRAHRGHCRGGGDRVTEHGEHQPLARTIGLRIEHRRQPRLGRAESFDRDDQLDGPRGGGGGAAHACHPASSVPQARFVPVVEAAVMGAGAWGTALAKVLADAGNGVTLWTRRPELAAEINDTHRNTAYLGDVDLPSGIRATSDAASALDGACTVLLAVPSQTLRTNLGQWRDAIGGDTTLVSVAKGIELNTLMRMTQVIIQVTGADSSRVAVVSGPNLASEIVMEQPAATVVACAD